MRRPPGTSFWQTLPGILTALAGAITTLTALLALLSQIGVFRTVQVQPTPTWTPTPTTTMVVTVTLAPSSSTLTPTPSPTTPTPSPTTPTPIGTPQPATLYAANWTKGLDGWTGLRGGDLTGWTVYPEQGELATTGHSSYSIQAPYRPGDHNIRDYAIEAEISIDQNPSDNDAFFAIIVRQDQQSLNGYHVRLHQDSAMKAGICVDSSGTTTVHAEYDCDDSGDGNTIFIDQNHTELYDNKWHKYRVTVYGHEISVKVDGGNTISRRDATYYAAGGMVGFECNKFQISIKNFKIIALP